jgi:cytochrome c biogenesis protein CcdA
MAEKWLSRILAPIAARAGKATVHHDGLWGHFVTGAMLGAVWSPCSGPALGAAVGLATEASTAARGFLLMLVFSLAASTPLLAIAYGARSIFMANRSRLAVMTSRTKPVFGLVLVVASVAILSGWDRQAEAALVKELPTGWVNLMTKF